MRADRLDHDLSTPRLDRDAEPARLPPPGRFTLTGRYSLSRMVVQREADPAVKEEKKHDRMVFVDSARLQTLREETAMTGPLVDAFLTADGQVYGMAAIHGVSLDDPQAAANKLKAEMPAVAQADKDRIEGRRESASTNRNVMQTDFARMQTAKDDLRAAVRAAAGPGGATPREPAGDDGLVLAWDAMVEAAKLAVEGPFSVWTLALTAGGTDLAKSALDHEKRLGELEGAVDRAIGAVNAAIAALGKDAAERARNAIVAFQRAAAGYRRSVQNYARTTRAYLDDLKKVLAHAKQPAKPGADKPGAAKEPAADGIAATYRQIIQAGDAYQIAKDALITHELSPTAIPYWVGLLVPTGMPVEDLPDSGRPGGYAGGMSVFAKPGPDGMVQHVFRTDAGVVQDLSRKVERVAQVHDTGPKAEARAAAWTAAMQATVGL